MKSNEVAKIRARLWDSMEMAHARNQLIISAVAGVFFLVLFRFRNVQVPEIRTMMTVFTSVIFLLPVGYWLWRVLRIFQRTEEYVFCAAELCQPRHAPMTQGRFTFCAVIETEQKGRFLVETRPIFISHGIGGPLMEDYVGKTVTLAWNRETEAVVVIG